MGKALAMSLRQRVHAFMNPEARTVSVNPTGSLSGRFAPQVAASSALRRRTTRSAAGSILVANEQEPKRGMWVVYGIRTGILTKLELGDVATVMLVDDQGLNRIEIHVPAKDLRQAWFEEIPAPRRPDYEHASRAGYYTRPA
jgi:hypothetical protein